MNKPRPIFRRNTLCQFIAMALFGGAAHAATPPPFSQAWLAAKQAGSTQPTTPTPGNGAGNNGGNVFTPGNVMLQQRVQQSIANLDAAAQAVAAQMAAQKSAQQAAQQLASNVPDGIAAGGLKVDRNVLSDPTLWQNANAPTQSVANGQTTVEVKQNASKAILTWESFNVGRHTTVHFDQTGGNQTDGGNQWIALNRINDPSGNPSTILGQIKAEGTVYLLNRNGVMFGGGAQVNTHSLLASSLDLFTNDVTKSNAFFLKYGIGANSDPENILGNGGSVSAMLKDNGDAAQRGAITVEKGASITSTADGFTLLAAPSIKQAGQIVADDGQVILAAVQTLGLAPSAASGSGKFDVAGLIGSNALLPGSVENSGLIQARRGSIHWLGEDMHQDGVLVTSTSLSHPASIVFDPGSNGSLPSRRLTFGTGSVTTILPEKDGETTTSTADASSAFETSSVNVNVTSVMDTGALMEVPAGNVTFSQDAYVSGGATIDVSGLANVTLPMSALLVIIPRIGLNELADSPLLRNSFLYTAKNVAIDSSQSGTRADGLDWVGSPVLNVSGYVNNVPRTVDELMIRSGNIAFNQNAIIRTGAQLRLEGGFLNYLPGYIATPRLQAANGLLYDIASADPNVAYTGFAGVFNSEHARWGVTETYTTSPLLANMGRWDPGFISGGDAGTLSFGQSDNNYNLILDGDVSAHAYAGREQVRGGTQPMAGTLDIELTDLVHPPTPFSSFSASSAVNFVVQSDNVPIEAYAPDFNADDPWPMRGGDPSDPSNPRWWHTLSTAMIDNAGFRKVRLLTPGTVLVKDGADLHVADGGEVDITAVNVDVEGAVTAHGGTIDIAAFAGNQDKNLTKDPIASQLSMGAHARLDTSGLWVNDSARSADDVEGDRWIDGGSVTLSGITSYTSATATDPTPDILLAQGSVIDVSGGGYVDTHGQLSMDGDLPSGRGGDVTIQTHLDRFANVRYAQTGQPKDLLGGSILLGSTLIANGFSGGGTLTLHAPQIQIGGEAAPTPDAALLYLDPSTFSALGFSRYSLIADTDATVAPGTQIVVQPRAMVADRTALLSVGSRTSLLGGDGQAAVAQVGDVDAYQRYLHRGTSDGLSIQAGGYRDWTLGSPSTPDLRGVTGSVVVGDGAHIMVDAGSSIDLKGNGLVVVDGTLTARGGAITLDNTDPAVSSSKRGVFPNSAVWLGAESGLDTSGISLLDPAAGILPRDGTGDVLRRDGTVLNGGSIALLSDHDVVAERGAQLLLSGASDTYDLPSDGRRVGLDGTPYVASPVWSDAGSLNIESNAGLYFDGSIDAHGGAPGARGGQVAISGLLAGGQSSISNGQLFITQDEWRLPAGSDPSSPIALDRGDGGDFRFAAARLDGSGVDDLYLGRPLDGSDRSQWRRMAVVFTGDVDLQTGRSIQIQTLGLTAVDADARAAPVAGAPTQGGRVTLQAPYVSIYGADNSAAPLASTGTGSLEVNADFIDLGGLVNLSGFAQASFNASGDLRFSLPDEDAALNETGWLYSAGNLDFTASRLYPMTHYAFLIDAVNPTSETTVTFHQAASTDDSTPLSAGGTLAVAADHIEQEGTLWVPSGSIVLGTNDPAATRSDLGLSAAFPIANTRDVHLAPGSVTSVSLNGAVLPYGSTQDGKDWHYDNMATTPSPLVGRPPEKSVSIAGDAVAVDAGATVDLSGGGNLQAEEWIPGTGGSRDVLAQTYTDYTTSQKGVQRSQYADNRPIYAVVPGYHAPVSAHDAALELGAGAGPAVGQAVYLSGVPGLPDGVYTLLPARYATLPGAFRVVQNTGVKDPVVGRSTTAPDGSVIASGYFTDALTGARDARSSSFTVQSADVWGQYSEYSLTSATTFFGDKAASNGEVAPRLAADAGRLTIAATAALTLGATLDAAPAKGGRGSQVDIAGDAIQILGAGESARDGYLHISADELSRLGAGSLLVGGKRESTADGDRVDVLASNVLLSNDAAHPLQGSEVILVANGTGGVTLDDGSVLRATATDDPTSDPLLIGQLASGTTSAVSGDGALLRVSGTDAAAVVRRNITGLDGPAGSPVGNLAIGAGAVIASAGSISMDATGLTSLASDATLGAHAIDVTAGRIGLTGTDPSIQDQAGSLLIGPRVLAQLANSDETTLRGRQGIDFIGDVDLAVSNALTLSAPTVESDGGRATIAAGTLTFANDTGASPAATQAGSGTLQANVRELHLGSGDVAFRGLGEFGADASGGVYASGVGSIDLGAAAVDIATPRIVASLGADNHLVTTGAMHLVAGGDGAGSVGATGGKIGFQAGSIELATNIAAPGGKVSLHASQGDVTLADGASIDVGGTSLPFNDVSVYLPGGTVSLQSDTGNVLASAGSTIDVRGSDVGGNAGTVDIVAEEGSAALNGALLGKAADGYLGGVLSINTAGALDLGTLVAQLTAGGIDGSVSVHTRAGDLSIGAGSTLHSHLVTLTADGGDVDVAGGIDASGTFGGSINLYGARGVDIDGVLDTSASAAGRRGGDIVIGTSGTGSQTDLNGTYGYENVQRVDAGHIRIGSGAHIDQGGDAGNGKLSLRAPLLADGDVPVDLAPGLDLSHTSQTSLEAYAVWDTRDAKGDLAKYFDGLIDPAGWFTTDPSTGKTVLVPGSFQDDSGAAVAGPDPADEAQVADYLSRYRFTPDDPNLAHESFYGYAGGDASQGAGTLMGFIEHPGFTFESRLQAALPALQVRPGVELRNSDETLNGGDISVLTNWNLGAGTRDADGNLQLAYRYGSQAPVLSLRAEGDLNVQASITDGFYQEGNAGGGAGAAPPLGDWAYASAEWQKLVDTGLGVEALPDLFFQPEQLSGDSLAVGEYYGQYGAYIEYLLKPLVTSLGDTGQINAGPGAISVPNGLLIPVDGAPAAPAAPVNLNAYPAYLKKYDGFLTTSAALTDFGNSFSMPDTFQPLAAPPTTLDVIETSAPVDNSPSPRAVASNPLPILSATLAGGNSSTYRLIGGADIASSDPNATMQGALGAVQFGGHTDYADSETGRVLAAPTVVRTGTGDIEIAAAGDIRWTDERAPAAVYTAGAPALGTTADGTVSLLRPSETSGLIDSATPELVVTGAVNPDGAGHLSLRSGGDIIGLQETVDTTGDLTGTAGTPTAQYWWQWLQTGNTDTRSSINFGGFGQGLMSVGGNVSVEAAGDIRQLSVSLPTTWAITNGANGVPGLQTFGGGDLNVHAGGDILSGSYFVAKGQGQIFADGRIGNDFSMPYTALSGTSSTMPVSTLIAMQDSQVKVQAGGSVSLGGIFNPSWIDVTSISELLPVGHADAQSYSGNSRIDVSAFSGDLRYGDLVNPVALFAPGLSALNELSPDTAGVILPSTVNLTAANGSLMLESAGELFPSSNGNLSLLASENVGFNIPRQLANRSAWGLIDAPLASMASPLNTDPLIGSNGSFGGTARQIGYLSGEVTLDPATQAYFHASTPWHATDDAPVRVYAVLGDITNGDGGGVSSALLMPNKAARIEAGRDIVDLAYLGQQIRASDISVVKAGRDIIDTPLGAIASQDQGANVLPVIAQAGPGYLSVEAGRNLGRLSSQTELFANKGFTYVTLPAPAGGGKYTGIDTVGNTYNPYLPSQGASIIASYGVAPGVDRAAFISRYIDPSAVKPPGLDDGSASLVDFVENYDAGLAVDTGLVADRNVPGYSVGEAWARFQKLPEEAKAIFVQQTLFHVLAEVGKDYNDSSSPFSAQYVRGYEALNTLFPASLGYTANGLDGGSNGTEQRVHTGDLDIRGSTIQTQRGGDVSIVAPGGDALLGSISAPPVIIDNSGTVQAGPNTQGILTLRQGDVSLFTDGSTLLAQSRIFTEQGGDVTIWSSNGDINAGKGAKTTSEIPPVRYLCTIDAWCLQDAAGQVSGAGIATLQTIPGAPEGSVYLMAPRGTVDAGDAGIRVSGNLVVAAAHVANADNVQVKGDSVGLPVVQSVNVGALNAASSAATAATKAAEDVARQQQSDARDRQPSIISVQVIGSDPSASIDSGSHGTGYDQDSPVQVVRRAGAAGDGLTTAERARLMQ
jgi:filamentous hemagglutinin family protein